VIALLCQFEPYPMHGMLRSQLFEIAAFCGT
jgi:hypothetical protein